MREAITGTRADIVSTAERRLDRTLTAGEKRGVECIGSLMMLESFQQEVASEKSTPAQIEKSLANFASKTPK